MRTQGRAGDRRLADAPGADVEARVRFGDSYAAAMLEAVVDRRASALVTPLSLEEGLIRGMFGGELERIGRESPVPVIGVRTGPEPITKVVLASTARRHPADRYEQQLAVTIARALGTTSRVPLTVGAARSGCRSMRLGLPAVTEPVLGNLAIANHPEVLMPARSLVVPASLVRRVRRRRHRVRPEHHDATGGDHRRRPVPVARVAGRRARRRATWACRWDDRCG